jgi:tetratricopeptide (TPR) repeat protein
MLFAKWNPRYRLLLACALVGRVSSLTRATVFEETHARNQAKYARWKAEWEAAQQDRTNSAYGTLPPQLPPVRLTADDNQPFLWNRRETTAHIETLSLRAVQEFETAVTGEAHRLSTTEQQAEDLWIYGCALLLLCRPANYLAPLYTPKKEYSSAFSVQRTAEKAVSVLRRASELVPDSARYWQALSDIHYFLADWRINTSEEARKENLRAAVAAYERSLTLEPKQPRLHFHLYSLLRDKSEEMQREAALNHLAFAVRQEASNAVYRILLFLEQIHTVRQQIQNQQGATIRETELRSLRRACVGISTGHNIGLSSLNYPTATHPWLQKAMGTVDSPFNFSTFLASLDGLKYFGEALNGAKEDSLLLQITAAFSRAAYYLLDLTQAAAIGTGTVLYGIVGACCNLLFAKANEIEKQIAVGRGDLHFMEMVLARQADFQNRVKSIHNAVQERRKTLFENEYEPVS